MKLDFLKLPSDERRLYIEQAAEEVREHFGARHKGNGQIRPLHALHRF